MCIRALPLYDALPEDRDDRLDTLVVSVVRCALAQPKDHDDWRRTTIFQTYVKSGTKDCRVIVDSWSCTNAISSNIVSRLGLKSIPHPTPYKVSWVDSSSITIKERCLVSIQILSYKDEIWCDVILMDVGHLILGRPWLFDMDVTLFGCSNSCSFEFNGKRIKLNPVQPKTMGANKNKDMTKP